MIFDDRRCTLGEGPLWHPMRKQLFWFDILGKRLLTRNSDGPQEWHFAEMVSAAGWVSHDELLIASETQLFRFDLETGAHLQLASIEGDNPLTRSNDGRADPQGGFWIGTMAKDPDSHPRAGSIWRYYLGELRRLYTGLSITNAICFTPDGRTAQFADTATGKVMRVSLDAEGWPRGEPSVFLDLSAQGLNPDGAVIAANGMMFMAQWGASRVAAYAPDGRYLHAVEFDAPHTSCPAFGDQTLYCTTALQGMDAPARAAHPQAGMTFAAPGVATGQKEHQVIA